MANDVAIFENVLRPLTPKFEQALGGAVPVERLMRSIMISVERTPKLLQADRQSLLNASMSAACLGLEVDGVTGQAYFVPFAGKVQLIIGYRGMNTMAARSGYTVQGEVVRDGDAFDYELGDRGFVRHKPKLGNQGEIIAAWATASSLSRPAIVSILGIDDIMAIMMKSPGAKMSDSPWRDKTIGFPAMASKSAKRRLSRAMPLNADSRLHQAATMEENFEERGKMSWIDPNRGVMIDGEIIGDAPQINHDQRSTQELLVPRGSATPSQAPGDGAADELADDLLSWDSKLATAALMGVEALRETWGQVPVSLKKSLKASMDNRHKPTAEGIRP